MSHVRLPAPVVRAALALAGAALLTVDADALAAERPLESTILLGSGWYDCSRQRDEAVEARLEYRARRASRPLQALAASHATSDGALFLGAGIGYRLAVGRFDLTPSFVPGYYRPGRGLDLGHPLQFRSQLELGFRVAGGSRLTVAFSHLSNGGVGARNPGQESVTVGAEVRLGRQRPD